jgi:hypothetical protein
LKTQDVQFARLAGLFRCTLPNGLFRDVAFVRTCREVGWRPASSWSGCRVVEDADMMFVTPEYLIRGILLVDVNLQDDEVGERCFVDDVVDNDVFLRMGN